MGNVYIGDSSSKARELKSAYIGISNVARKLKAIYVGDSNNKARLVWQALKKKISSYNGTTQIGSFTDDNYYNRAEAIYKVNDNHILVGLNSKYSGSWEKNMLINLHLDNNGNVTSGTRFCPSSDESDMHQSSFHSICQFNDTYGACVTSVYHTGGGYSARYLCSFNLNASTGYIDRKQIEYSSSLDYPLPLVKLNNNCILIPDYNDNKNVFGTIYQCDASGKMNYKYNDCFSSNIPYKEVITDIEPVVFGLSGNRFAALFAVKQVYTADTDANRNIVVCVFSYSFDSSGNMNVVRDSYTLLPYYKIYGTIEPVGDDYFILSGDTKSIGFYINSNNNAVASNVVETVGHYTTRIGISDSILTYTTTSGSVIYYNKENNTINVTWTGSLPYEFQRVSYKEDSIMSAVANYSYSVTLNKMTFG